MTTDSLCSEIPIGLPPDNWHKLTKTVRPPNLSGSIARDPRGIALTSVSPVFSTVLTRAGGLKHWSAIDTTSAHLPTRLQVCRDIAFFTVETSLELLENMAPPVN